MSRALGVVLVVLAACGGDGAAGLDGAWTVRSADYASEGCLVDGETMPLPVALRVDGERFVIELANGEWFESTAGESLGAFSGGSIGGAGGWRLLRGAVNESEGGLSGYIATESSRGLGCYVELYVVRS